MLRKIAVLLALALGAVTFGLAGVQVFAQANDNNVNNAVNNVNNAVNNANNAVNNVNNAVNNANNAVNNINNAANNANNTNPNGAPNTGFGGMAGY